VSLAPGGRLGPYEIVSLLGSGGMGEVYKGRDTRLDRTVAIKVLPAGLASNESLRARFEREAHAISALQHPNICTLLDVGEENGEAYLVMEHLAGETLAERLKKGPFPLAQALETAVQIAGALAAAHKQGIVHRDLKPGNVMLTKTGVKLLDFGLARLTGHGERSVIEESAPTESAPLTGKGTLLGTVPYMAPEQLEGKPADARTDLWALGAIVYEMVAGRRAFEGSSQVSLIAAIVEREPVSLLSLQPVTPPSLGRLVERCLAKSPDDRWDSAHDVADELRWIARAAGETGRASGGRASRPRVMIGAVVLTLVGLLGGLAGWRLHARTAARAFVVRSLLDVRPAEELNGGGASTRTPPGGSRTALAWTPDGQSLVFVGRRGGMPRLYVRPLDADEPRPLEGSEGAQAPAVSPDGRWVAFWASGAIRKVPLAGGPVATVAEGLRAPPWGIAWGADGRLYYGGEGEPIWSVEPEHAPTALTRRLDGEVSHGLPHMLPGGNALLYTLRHRRWTWGDEEVVAHVLATGERKVLLKDAADARYVAPGSLVFMRRGSLMAAAFDLPHLAIRGNPVPVLDGVAQALTSSWSGDVSGAGQFSVSSTGTLAYVPSPVVPYADGQLVAVDRHGTVSPLDAPARSYAPNLSLAPDGRRLAVPIPGLNESALWLYDRERSTLGKMSTGGEASWPRWTPDGQYVAFEWLNQGISQLALLRADGTAAPQVLARDAGSPSSWSPDGKRLALVKDGDIWIAHVENGKATLEPLTQTPDIEGWPEFSPDGRWLAYASNTSGRSEVYVQPYPGPGPRQQVSLDGGANPAWSPTGREIFFVSPPDSENVRRMMASNVGAGAAVVPGKPHVLFEYRQSSTNFHCFPARCFAVAADGERFYARQLLPRQPPTPVTQIRLVQNWTEELKARVPSGAGR
jgi:Tol biopolymer transport system component